MRRSGRHGSRAATGNHQVLCDGLHALRRNFHRNEISAVLFSLMVINLLALTPERQESRAMHLIRGWAATALVLNQASDSCSACK